MKILFCILASVIAIATSQQNYESNIIASDNQYGGSQGYGQPQYEDEFIGRPYRVGHKFGEFYGSYERDHDFHKLRRLEGDNIERPTIRYFKHHGDNYAVISCGKTSRRSWILVDSEETSPSFSQKETAIIAGGTNVHAIVKQSGRNFIARNPFNDDRVKFRRVGCVDATF